MIPPIDSFEDVLAVSGLAFLVAFSLLLIYSVWRARRLMSRFATEHPAEYEAAGRPWPVYFDRLRQQQYQMFILQRGYQTVPDPVLLSAFEAHRRWERGFMVFLLGGFLLLGGAVAWVKYLGV